MSKKTKEILFDAELVLNTALTIRAVNHPLRQQIIELIRNSDGGKMFVTKIYKELEIEQSIASQHLAIMRDGGVLSTEKIGKFIYYKVNENRAEKINKVIELIGSASEN